MLYKNLTSQEIYYLLMYFRTLRVNWLHPAPTTEHATWFLHAAGGFVKPDLHIYDIHLNTHLPVTYPSKP